MSEIYVFDSMIVRTRYMRYQQVLHHVLNSGLDNSKRHVAVGLIKLTFSKLCDKHRRFSSLESYLCSDCTKSGSQM